MYLGYMLQSITHALVRPRYLWKDAVSKCTFVTLVEEFNRKFKWFGWRNPKVGVNLVHSCLSPFHVLECLLSQFSFCINDIVANGLKYIYNTFENDYYQKNEVCFIALISSCIMYFIICMKWSDVVIFRNNCTQKGSQTLFAIFA